MKPNTDKHTLLPIEKAALDRAKLMLTGNSEIQPFVLLSVQNRMLLIQMPSDSPWSSRDLGRDCIGLAWSFRADAVAFVAESWSAPADTLTSGIRPSEHAERFESLILESETPGNFGMRSYVLLRDEQRRFLGFGDLFSALGLPPMGNVRFPGRPNTLLPGSHTTKAFRKAARKAMERWATHCTALE